MINYIQFSYILSEVCGLTPDDTDKITRFLDPMNSRQINYNDLLKILENPSNISQVSFKR